MHNLVDSQGHTRILIPENPIITHLPHSENSCLGYPSYYITKKKIYACIFRRYRTSINNKSFSRIE